MKKINLLLLAGLCLVSAACSDDDEASPGLEINAADTGFEADGGEGGISIASMGKVDAAADKDWIEITSVADDSVHFRVAANPDALLRTGKIAVTGSGGRKEVTILQKGSFFSMDVPEGGIEFSGLGGEERSVALEYVMKGAMEISIESGYDESWLKVTQEEGRVVFTGTVNETNAPRSTVVTVKAGGKRVNVEVTQKAVEWVRVTESWTNATETGPEVIFYSNHTRTTVFSPSEIEEYDHDWYIEKHGEWGDWISIISGESSSTGKKWAGFDIDPNDTGKSRHVAVDIMAQGKAVQSYTVWQYPVDRDGEYFEGTWTLHSLNDDFSPQDTEIQISKNNAGSTGDLLIVGLDQQFTDQDPAAAAFNDIRAHPGVEMMCQDLEFSVISNNDSQEYALWIVPLSEELSLVRNTNGGWSWEYDRDTETLVVKPNDYIATTLPNANDGMQFPGFGVIGYNSVLGRYVNFGLGVYFPDPSRGTVWLERAAE